MKNFKKIFALLIAMVIVLGMSTIAFAADTGTITITPPAAIDPTTANSYEIYKVFDATVDATDNTKVRYTLCSGDTLSQAMIDAGFFTDDAGNVHYGTFTESDSGTYMVGGKKGTITENDELSEEAITAIGSYVTSADLVDTATSTGTAAATSNALPFGYYYIKTTTGTVVTIDSNNNNPTVDDKNTIPVPPDKSVTGVGDGSLDAAGEAAVAQVGTTVSFSAEIVKVKGAKNYVFHDTMDAGLSYKNDVAVKVGTETITASTTINTEAEGETFITTPTASGDTLTVSFDNEWLAKLPDNTTITITYSATVTSDALTVDAAKNTAKLEYGNGSKTDGDTVEVYNATLNVIKTDGSQALAGAGFILKNKDDDTYYKYTAATETTPAKVEWVTSEDDATEMITEVVDGKAEINFTGLANGTYVLIEKTTPTGYNTAADSEFTIYDADATTEANRKQSTTVINNSGSELPATGGMGTRIFYIVGAILALGAGIVLVTRRRAGDR